MRSVPCAAVLSVLGMLVAVTGWSQPMLSVPSFIRVGGMQSTTLNAPDPSIAFTARFTLNGVPLAGVQIDLIFQDCTDLRLCAVNSPGITVDCPTKRVGGVTNAAGEVIFSVVGGGLNGGTTVPPAVAPGAGTGCMRYYADGVLLGASTVAIYDQNGGLAGGNGVNGLDLSIVLTEIGAAGSFAPYRGRSDYSQDGVINGVDLSVYLTILGLALAGRGSGAGCVDASFAAYCP